MALFDTAVPASFDGISFPITEAESIGGLRIAEHEIPKRDGTQLEKNGRRAYGFRVSALFVDTSDAYPNLYPRDLTRLIAKFEDGVTGKLTLPGWGSYDCVCSNWNRSLAAAMISGERVSLEFKEDQEAITIYDLATPERIGAVDNSAAYFAKVRAQMAETPEEKSLFDKIESAAQVVKQIRDGADLKAQIYLARVQRLMGLCEEADRTVTSLSNPLNLAVLQSIQDLWYAATSIAEDLKSKQLKTSTYTVPKRMSISDVSQAIYESTAQVDELITLNSLPDYLNIPAGTAIRFYP